MNSGLRVDPVLSSLERRANELGAYLYVLLRLLELECAWLIQVTNLSVKAKFAGDIGAYATVIQRLQRRRWELVSDEHLPSAHHEVELSIASIASRSDISDIVSSVLNVQRCLVDALRADLSSLEFYDEPSRGVIGDAINILHERWTIWAAEHQQDSEQFSLESLHSRNGTVRYSDQLATPRLPRMPGRPASFRFSDDPILRHKGELDLVTDDDCMRRFLHFIALDIEVCAAEVCAQNVVEHRQMPIDFRIDMARQISDEMRHFELIAGILEYFEGYVGQYPYSATVFFRSALGRSLEERLAIQQIIQEGNAIESNIQIATLLQKVGYDTFAAAFEFINADEVNHVSFGNKWLQELCGTNSSVYMGIIRAASERVGAFPGSRGIAEKVRRHAGFPDEFFLEYLKE
ncbi:DUF455 family protein [Sinorhizobium fredii]|uniref:DUF455 family protein n=1 Tax=Rhizobium fredii TaxID=380 RepID=UPI0003068DE5|nr:DUF455 family protein [Sinorhizobium fredii]